MITYRAGSFPPRPPMPPGRPGPPERPAQPPQPPRPNPAIQPTRVWVEQGEWPGRLYERLLNQRIVMAAGCLDGEAATRLCAQLLTLDAEGEGPIRLELHSLDADLPAALEGRLEGRVSHLEVERGFPPFWQETIRLALGLRTSEVMHVPPPLDLR